MGYFFIYDFYCCSLRNQNPSSPWKVVEILASSPRKVLLFEKQAKYEETIKSYHEHHTNHEETDEKSVKTEDKDVEAKNDNKQ